MIGIVGYGVYIPMYRLRVEEIARVWQQDGTSIANGLMVSEKSVADSDEDTISISVEAARNALARARISSRDIGALFIGSESHPYAVKPSGTVVAEALDLPEALFLADYEFACKAGTAAIQTCYAMVKSEMIGYGLAIGADTAQGQPGDALEYTAAAGGAAFVIGKNPLVSIDATCSYTTDTPDFWRREGQDYPRHGARFTGKPAYFHHTVSAAKMLMERTGLTSGDFDYAVFHMPNGKFPREAAKMLGIPVQKIEQSLVVESIGNTYSGSSLLGLCNVLDHAKEGERILLTSFGSGAGSDAFALTVQAGIGEVQQLGRKTADYIARKRYIDYGTYAKLRGKLKL